MPDSKITALTSIGTSTDPANDPLVLVDVSDTSMAATGTTKKVTLNNLLSTSPTATGNFTITGDLTVDTSTLKVDSTNNRVGILTASPATGAALQVAGTTSVTGGTGASAANGLHFYFDTGTNGAFITAFHSGVDNRDLTYDAKTHAWRIASGQAMLLNSSGNLGLGVTPSAWGAGTKAFELANGSVISFAGYIGTIGTANSYYNGSNFIYKTTAAAARYDQDNGAHKWFNAPSGTAGNAITFTQAMTLEASGNLAVGVSTAAARGVFAGASSTLFKGLILRNADTTTGASVSLDFETSTGTQGLDATLAGRIAGIRTGAGTSGALAFSTTNGGTLTEVGRFDASGNLIWSPSATPPTLAANGQLTVNATSNTNLRFSYRGSDGVTRVANLTLA